MLRQHHSFRNRKNVTGTKALENCFNFNYYIMCGNVEKNAEPYRIAGIVQATFSQGHETFGVVRGIQCTSISFYSVCFSSFKPILEWLSDDLEYVIIKGDRLYKEQNRLALLSCVDLPRITDIENVKVTMTFLANVFGFLTENYQLELFDKIT